MALCFYCSLCTIVYFWSLEPLVWFIITLSYSLFTYLFWMECVLTPSALWLLDVVISFPPPFFFMLNMFSRHVWPDPCNSFPSLALPKKRRRGRLVWSIAVWNCLKYIIYGMNVFPYITHRYFGKSNIINYFRLVFLYCYYWILWMNEWMIEALTTLSSLVYTWHTHI